MTAKNIRTPLDIFEKPKYTARSLRQLPACDLDALYETLSLQNVPVGTFDGRAWIHGHPVLGWLMSLVWRGKVFDCVGPFNDTMVRNRVLGWLLFDGIVRCGPDEAIIEYPRLGLRDTVRQVTPTLYLGRMRWRGWTVHFTLEQAKI